MSCQQLYGPTAGPTASKSFLSLKTKCTTTLMAMCQTQLQWPGKVSNHVPKYAIKRQSSEVLAQNDGTDASERGLKLEVGEPF